MRKKLLIILALLFLINSTGCWDLREAEQTGIVIGAGLDRGKDGSIVVIAQTVIPQMPGAGGANVGGGAGGHDTFHNWYSSGETLFDAVRNLTQKSPNTLFWSHNKIFIISEKLARESLKDVIDFIERDPEFKQNAWIVIAKDDLSEIMNAHGNLKEPPAQALANIIMIRDRNSKYAVSTLGEFIQQLGNPEAQAYTAGVTFYKGLMEKKNTASISGQETERSMELRVMDTAVFKQDKLVGWLNQEESRGLLWVQGKVKEGLLVLPMQNHKMIFEILKSSSKLEPLIKDGQLIMKVQVKVDGNIGEITPGTKLDEKHIQEIEAQIAKTVEEQIMTAVSRAQELNTDFLGFASAVHRAFPRLWNQELSQQWSETLKDIEVEVSVEGRVRGTGLITNPVKLK
ncbi:Ger(x)C family spore germination protein [Desulforamulus aeronauticus]|uniref:Spore germination protein KC n=1 Tax=Desulforamulus aeronauticus DSM 10349 TaxID=1121421 RepID=A0A1M6RMS0_9FIRM|nr:Ger(x)C family spore germination protein [Desulforamulus aeronauticus]SHK33736.1 spore germination protein KC [Desulforamulus aeronauticus DSM 10349]